MTGVTVLPIFRKLSYSADPPNDAPGEPMKRRFLTATAALLRAGTAAVAVSTPAHAAAGLTAAFSAADNGSWWLDKYVVSNPTTASITGWTIEFDLPPGVTMTNPWNGNATTSGSHVTVTNAYYNGTVAPGRNTEPYSFSFIASGPAVPANCRINGNKCDGGSDRAPGAPAGLA